MRRRFRQISVDDSNSMSNLAKIIMEELESASPCQMNGDTDSSDMDLASTLPASALREKGGLSALNIPCDDIDLSQSNHF